MKKQYIQCEPIKRTPVASVLTRQEKEARIYNMASKLKVKIGKGENENVDCKG